MTANRYDMKKLAKVAWAGFCTYSRLSNLVLRIRKHLKGSAPVAILTYHRILPVEEMDESYSSPQIITSKRDFEKQIRFLANHYQVLPLDSLADLPRRGATRPTKCVVVTFDDGWQDNYHHAFPVLRKYRIPATIFLTTGFIGHHHAFWQEHLRFLLHVLSGKTINKGISFPESVGQWREDLTRIVNTGYSRSHVNALVQRIKDQDETMGGALVSELDAFLGHPEFPIQSHAFLTWAQIREMAADGVSFGSHTHRHRLLNRISDKEVDVEIRESKQRLETELGREVSTFAYPSGTYRSHIFGQLQAAGYRLAVTTEPGLNFMPTTSFYQLRRINVESKRFQGVTGEFSESLFAARMAGML